MEGNPMESKGKNKGVAFVLFDLREQAEKASANAKADTPYLIFLFNFIITLLI